MWFQVTPVDADFTSAHQFVNEIEIAAPPEQVFRLVIGERFEEWLPDLVSMEWTSPAPHGVGSTRTVTLKNIAVKERIVVWDEGRRFAFCMEAATRPLIKRMLEDLRIEPLGDARCRLRYVASYEPTLLTRALHPIVRRVFGKLFRDATRSIARIAEQTARAAG